MTKREKCEKLLDLNNPFEGIVDEIVGEYRKHLPNVEGMTPERMKVADAALDKYRERLVAMKDERQNAMADLYERVLTDEQLDAMLVLVQAPEAAKQIMVGTIEIQKSWSDKAYAETPELLDLMFAVATNWAANNTEGEVAESIRNPPAALDDITPTEPQIEQ